MAAAGDFLTLDQAKAHLRVTITAEDDLIALYLWMAQSLIVDRLERATTDSLVLGEIALWDGGSVPEGVRAATLVQLGELYAFRGDDLDLVTLRAEGRLSPQVERFLGSWLERPIA